MAFASPSFQPQFSGVPQQYQGQFARPQYPQQPQSFYPPQQGFYPPQQSQRPTLTPKDDYLARLASHDNQFNGANQPFGPDGTIFYQTALNPANGQAAVFLNTPERQQWFREAIQTDLSMNGKLDGDVLRDAIRKTYYAATGANIPQIMSLPLGTPDTRQSTIFKQVPDPMKPGGLQQMAQTSGLSTTQLGIYSLWGHDASLNKQITNPNTQTFLRDAATNPQSRDYGLINGVPEIKSYVNGLMQNPQAGDRLNQDFLNTLEKVFRSPGLLQNVHQQPQQPGGWPPQQPGGWPPQQPGGWPPQQPRGWPPQQPGGWPPQQGFPPRF